MTDDSKKQFTNSGQLLECPIVTDYIKKYSTIQPNILYFKPSAKLDFLVRKLGYNNLSNSTALNDIYENKISFYQLINILEPDHVIPSQIGILKSFEFNSLQHSLGLSFVVQFGKGWAGKTTYFINNLKDFIALQNKFPSTRVRISKKIVGFTVLNNVCIYRENVLISPPAVQISNIPILSDREGMTCGRQWPVSYLTADQIETIRVITSKLGSYMSKKGYKGYFGIDFIIESTSGKVYLSELNARFTASCPFYTRLERDAGLTPLFIYHISDFLKIEISSSYNQLNKSIVGSQLIIRNPVNVKSLSGIKDVGVHKLNMNHFEMISSFTYPETLHDDEYLILKRQRAVYADSDEVVRMETKGIVLKNVDVLKDEVFNFVKDFKTGSKRKS
jgi:hypothetical protein